MIARTSTTHPLQIAEVNAPAAKGVIGVTFCPGKKQTNAMSGAWNRDLGIDLDAIARWGASTVITLIEPHEFLELKVEELGPETERRNMQWLHMPIRDVSAPDAHFEKMWRQHGERLVKAVRDGQRVLVHCKGGLGRAGTVAALLLVELGMAPAEAIRAVRIARKGAIETPEQEAYIHAHAARRVETVLEVGADGGIIRLVRRQGRGGLEFRVQTSEAALYDGDPDLAPAVRPWVASWDDALAQLDSYPWVRLHPLAVHPGYREEVNIALKRRAGGENHIDWAGWNEVLAAERI